MRLSGLIIGAVLLAALSGLLYWSNKREKEKEGKPVTSADAPKILDLKEDNLTRVEIAKQGEKPLVIEKAPENQWKLTSPEALPADQDAVRSVVSTVTSLDSNRLIEEKAEDLAGYGLDSPSVEVNIGKKEGQGAKLLIGDETPTGGSFFAKLANDPRVFTIASWNKTSLEKSPWDLRDKRMLTFDSDKLTRLRLTAKKQTIEIGKNAQNEWQILEPRPMRADGGNVEQLISRLRDAKMDSNPTAEEEKKAAAAFARAEPVASVRVSDAAGAQELEVRKTKDNDYYARSTVVGGIHKITSFVGEGVDKGLADLRNKKLFDFGWNDPTRIEFRDGDQTAVYEKSGDNWTRGGKQMDSATVRELIDKLRDLAATEFPDKGFTPPAAIEAKVTWEDGKRTEKALISKSGDKYYAIRENEPSVYELGASSVEQLQQAAKDIKEPEAKKDEKKPS
ncbi:MAG: DUF4340 domain-containing protein [Bryobacteraceae bacterium]|nr:DUF4340 domain-containing protein [Bryobacteraceae bacterium]